MKKVTLKYAAAAAIALGVLAGCGSYPATTVLPAGNYTYPVDQYNVRLPVTYTPAGTWYYPADTYYTGDAGVALGGVGCGNVCR